MAKPTHFVQRLVEALIRGEIAREDVCRLGKYTSRPFGVQAQLRIVFSHVGKECAAYQPTTAGNNDSFQPNSLLGTLI